MMHVLCFYCFLCVCEMILQAFNVSFQNSHGAKRNKLNFGYALFQRYVFFLQSTNRTKRTGKESGMTTMNTTIKKDAR